MLQYLMGLPKKNKSKRAEMTFGRDEPTFSRWWFQILNMFTPKIGGRLLILTFFFETWSPWNQPPCRHVFLEALLAIHSLMHLRHCLILKLKGISQCDAKKMFVEVVFEALLKKNGCFLMDVVFWKGRFGQNGLKWLKCLLKTRGKYREKTLAFCGGFIRTHPLVWWNKDGQIAASSLSAHSWQCDD